MLGREENAGNRVYKCIIQHVRVTRLYKEAWFEAFLWRKGSCSVVEQKGWLGRFFGMENFRVPSQADAPSIHLPLHLAVVRWSLNSPALQRNHLLVDRFKAFLLASAIPP